MCQVYIIAEFRVYLDNEVKILMSTTFYTFCPIVSGGIIGIGDTRKLSICNCDKIEYTVDLQKCMFSNHRLHLMSVKFPLGQKPNMNEVVEHRH